MPTRPCIAIDIRQSTRLDGKGIYLKELTNHLITNKNYNWILLDSFDDHPFKEDINIKIVSFPKRFWHFKVRNFLLKNNVSHYLSVTSFITPFLLKKRIDFSIFIHDLIAFQSNHSHPFKPTLVERFFLPRIIHKAKNIFTVSNFTKQDLLKRFPTLNEEVVTVSSASFKTINQDSKQISPLDNKLTNIKSPFILSVSSLLPRKNYETLIKAISKLSKFNGKLVIVGSTPNSTYYKKLLKLIAKLELQSKVIFLQNISNQDLEHLYQTAILSVYPSSYEGFGLPLLESLAAGCPVIAAENSSLIEVGKDAVCYFDTYSSEDLSKKIEDLISNKELRQEYLKKASTLLQNYSWEKVAQTVLSQLTKSL